MSHPLVIMGGMERITAFEFGHLASTLAAAARRKDLCCPGFRSPPRRTDVTRSVRRLADGAIVVAVRTHGRSRSEVVVDMVEGVMVANSVPPSDRPMLRRALLDEMTPQDLPAAA